MHRFTYIQWLTARGLQARAEAENRGERLEAQLLAVREHRVYLKRDDATGLDPLAHWYITNDTGHCMTCLMCVWPRFAESGAAGGLL